MVLNLNVKESSKCCSLKQNYGRHGIERQVLRAAESMDQSYLNDAWSCRNGDFGVFVWAIAMVLGQKRDVQLWKKGGS